MACTTGRDGGLARVAGPTCRRGPAAALVLGLLLLLGAAGAGEAQGQGAVTAVTGDRVDLYLGPGHTVEVGDLGVVWRVEAAAAGFSRERVATIRATRTSAQSAVAQVVERVPGRDVEIGLEVSFEAGEVPREDEIVSLVELGDRLYAAGEYDAAAGAYERASALDPTVRNAGARHVMAMVRGAIASGDRGPVFDAAVSAFRIVEQMRLPEPLAAQVDATSAALEQALAPPTPTPTPAPPTPTPTPEPSPTPVPVREGDLVDLGPGVVPPEITSQVNPEFPEIARRRIDSGEVQMQLLVGIDGRVEEVRVVAVEPEGFGLEQAAERAVRRWRFRPATADGVKVRMWFPVRIVFRN